MGLARDDAKSNINDVRDTERPILPELVGELINELFWREGINMAISPWLLFYLNLPFAFLISPSRATFCPIPEFVLSDLFASPSPCTPWSSRR